MRLPSVTGQCEGGVGLALRVPATAPISDFSPITLGPSNVWGKRTLISQRMRFLSLGNTYAYNFVLDADFINGASLSDGMWDFQGQGVNFVALSQYAQVVCPTPNFDKQGFGPIQIHAGAPSAALLITYDSLRLGTGETKLGVYGADPVARPTVTGSRASGAALASLLSQLATLGLLNDGTIP